MSTARVNVASPTRPAASTHGPMTGAATRMNMKEAPQRAERPTSWAK